MISQHAAGNQTLDTAMMKRCLALAMQAAEHGEYPYAAIICRRGEVICETTTSVRHDRDATQHAELRAIRKAYRSLKRIGLEDCTIYSSAEPCALCSYAIRESRIRRVVYGIPAPLTGGLSRWNILADRELSDRLPDVFAPPPEILAGFMCEQIEAAIHPRAQNVRSAIATRNEGTAANRTENARPRQDHVTVTLGALRLFRAEIRMIKGCELCILAAELI